MPFQSIGLAFLLLGPGSFAAAPAYVRQELFEEGQGGDNSRSISAGALLGSGTTQLLNNRGEVAYLHGPVALLGTTAPSRPGLWLPNPSYGLPAGFNDIKGADAVQRQMVLLDHYGNVYCIVQRPHGLFDPPEDWYQVLEADAAGERLMGSAYVVNRLPPRFDTYYKAFRDRRQRLTARGVAAGVGGFGAAPFGEALVEVKWESEPDNTIYWKLSTVPEDYQDSGYFDGPDGSSVVPAPGMENAPVCAAGGPAPHRRMTLHAASPGGTVVTTALDLCGDIYPGYSDFSQTLGVITPSSTRAIVSGRYKGPTTDPEIANFGYVVNDAGMVAGSDTRGLWLSPNLGRLSRSGVTNATQLYIDGSGDVWFTRGGGIEKWTATGVHPLDLPWASWGFIGDPHLVTVNDFGQILIRVLKTNGKTAAVVLSPVLSASLTTSDSEVPVGGTVTVTATLTARGGVPVTGIAPDGALTWRGTGGVKVLSGPIPVPPLSLAPFAETTFQWTCQATNLGVLRFAATFRGLAGATTVFSPPASSEPVRFTVAGDLLIKRGSEEYKDYRGRDQYNPALVVSGDQHLTNAVDLGHAATFDVLVRNPQVPPAQYVLRGIDNERAGWIVKYLIGGGDVTAALRSGGELPDIPGHGELRVTVQITPVRASLDDLCEAKLALSSVLAPGDILDAVQAVARVRASITVNSTGDLPNLFAGAGCDTGRIVDDDIPECTLRAAIQVANAHPGPDIIFFDIPWTDPNYTFAGATIEPLEALPDITGPVTISAEAQSPTAQGWHRVELSGAKIRRPRPPVPGGMVVVPWLDVLAWEGAASGLTLLAKSDVQGLVIHGFPLCGVLIKAPGCEVSGCYIGTALDGNSGLPNGLGVDDTALIRGCGIGIQSSGNRVVGNVISGGSPAGSDAPDEVDYEAMTKPFQEPPGLVIQGTGASGNVVLGNHIGTTKDGSRAIVDAKLLAVRSGLPAAGILIDGAPRNIIGSLDQGNLISGNLIGVYILGPNATGNAVDGNIIGTDATTRKPVPNVAGIFLDDAPGNTIGGSLPHSGNWVAGNDIGILVEGSEARDNTLDSNTVGAFPPRRGGADPIGNAHGIELGQDSSRTLVIHNRVRLNRDVGIFVEGSSVNKIIGNTVELNGKTDAFASSGIRVESGSANLVSRNGILQNGRFSGLHLGTSIHPVANDDKDADEGANGLQNRPFLGDHDVFTLGSDLRIVGELSTTPSGGTYVLEFFTGSFLPATSWAYGDAEHFLGAADVTVDASGFARFNLSFPRPTGITAKYVTATATARDGSTSELCDHATIYPCRELDADGNCAELEEDCPPRVGPPRGPSLQGMPRRTPQQASPVTGDGNGDGVPDSRQANVASLPTQPGVWVTLTQAEGTRFQNVRARGTPGLTGPPSELAFPLAFLRFGLTNVPRGGTLTVTNYLHLDATPESDYQATTYLNYGATPDDPQPHWYEFLYDGSTGAELFPDRILLHFRDGGRGDADLAANGGIVTFGGPAYRTPSGPRLELRDATVSLLDGKTTQLAANGTSITVASQVPVVTSVLAWPADATNHALYFKGDLSPAETRPGANRLAGLDLWRPVLDPPASVNEWLVVTNSALGSSGFYELEERPGAVLDRMTPQRLAGGIYTWIGEGTWSVATNWDSTALTLGPPPLDGLTTVGIVFVPGATPVVSTVDGAYSILGLTVSGASPGVELQAGTPGARLALGAGGLAHLAAGTTELQPDVALGARQFWRVDSGTLSVASLDLGPHALTASGAGRLVVRALAGEPSSRFAANGGGPVELGVAAPGSSFRGTLAIAGGSVTVSEGLFQGAGALEVTSGSLILPSQATLSSLSPVSLSGGGIVRNGANGNLGPLQLGGEGALWLGPGTGSLSFVSAGAAGTSARLTVHDWQGTGGVSGTGVRLFLGASPDPALLAAITFVGSGFGTGAIRLASGEIVPTPGATWVLPTDALAKFQAYGTGLTKTVVPVTGQAFTQAMRVDTTQKAAQAYNSGIQLRTSEAVAANDNLLARFWIRRVAPASGGAQVQFNFELASGAFDKSVQFPVSLNNEQWQLKTVKFKSRAAYAAGAAEVSFWAGYGIQTVEIAGLEVLNYRGTTPP